MKDETSRSARNRSQAAAGNAGTGPAKDAGMVKEIPSKSGSFSEWYTAVGLSGTVTVFASHETRVRCP
jgi:hypothetical protein